MNFDSRRPLNRQTIRKKASNLFSFVINWRSQNMYHAGSRPGLCSFQPIIKIGSVPVLAEFLQKSENRLEM